MGFARFARPSAEKEVIAATRSAMRQAAYRQRHLGDEQMVRLDRLVDSDTKYALQRLAAYQGIPSRGALTQLIASPARNAAWSQERCGQRSKSMSMGHTHDHAPQARAARR